MIWGIFSLILLLVTIALVIWLLVRGDNCPKRGNLNDTCNSGIDCNGGLVCSAGSGTALTTNNNNASTAKTCKVAGGEVCAAASDCAAGLTCQNGICVTQLGTGGQSCPCAVGFTCVNNICLAVAGQACTASSDCATGMCENNVCVSSSMGPTGCSSYSSYDTSDYSSRCDTSDYSRDSYSRNSGSHTRDSGSGRYSYDSRRHSYDSSYSACSDTSDSHRRHSYDSYSSYAPYSDDTSYYSKHHSYDTSECYSDHKYVRRGVYVTNEQNQDQTLFTQIEQPIMDIVKTDKIYLLLKNGNVAANMGMNTTMYTTNKKMMRMVRFGSDIVGMDKKGKLYYAAKSNGNVWNWNHLTNFPDDVEFIDSTNTGSNLEVLTCRGKAFVYAASANWKEGKYISSRKTRDYRYYGKDLARYIDIDQRTYVGKTNDGQKVKGVKAAGFYPSNVLVPVLEEDSFTHNRVIDSKAYFLFEQNY